MDEDIRVECVEINVTSLESSKVLHQKLKESLEFPSFYGMNWNAFWDAITGLVELPEKIVFLGWGDLESSIPDEANKLKTLLEEFNEKHPSWACKVEYK